MVRGRPVGGRVPGGAAGPAEPRSALLMDDHAPPVGLRLVDAYGVRVHARLSPRLVRFPDPRRGACRSSARGARSVFLSPLSPEALPWRPPPPTCSTRPCR